MPEQEVRAGAERGECGSSPRIDLYLTQIPRERITQQRTASCSAVHTGTVRPNTSCYILCSKVPLQFNSKAAESQIAQNEVSGKFILLLQWTKNTNLFQVLSRAVVVGM